MLAPASLSFILDVIAFEIQKILTQKDSHIENLNIKTKEYIAQIVHDSVLIKNLNDSILRIIQIKEQDIRNLKDSIHFLKSFNIQQIGKNVEFPPTVLFESFIQKIKHKPRHKPKTMIGNQ